MVPGGLTPLYGQDEGISDITSVLSKLSLSKKKKKKEMGGGGGGGLWGREHRKRWGLKANVELAEIKRFVHRQAPTDD